jgi:phage baseplate assembly protein W
MNIAFPFHIDASGRTATASDADHVRDMILLLLFTQPGERVMRPDFGTGLLQFVHAANSPEIASALKVTLQAALTKFLGDVIEIGALDVDSVDAELTVTLSYIVRATGEARTDTFVRGAA